MRFGGLLLFSQYYLHIFKGKMESRFECTCSTPLHSHNTFAVENYARLMKDSFYFVIQQCCSCQWFENIRDLLEKCLICLVFSSFIFFLLFKNTITNTLRTWVIVNPTTGIVQYWRTLFFFLFFFFNQFTIAFGFCCLFLHI